MNPRIKGSVVVRKEDWGGIAVDNATGKIHRLSKDDYEVLKHCDGTNSIHQIHAMLKSNAMYDDKSGLILSGVLLSSLRKGVLVKERDLLPTVLAFADSLGIQPERVTDPEHAKKSSHDVLNSWVHYPLKSPVRVSLQVTSKCNLNCVHCFANSQAKNNNHYSDFSHYELIELIDKLRQMEVPQVTISGGEPLLRSDIFSILRRCIDAGFSVLLDTNGTLITPEVAQQLKSIGLNFVSVSIDGVKPETHDRWRGADGAYEKVMKGLQHLIDANIGRIRVQSVANRSNIDELPLLTNLLDEMEGINEHRILRFVPIGRGKDMMDEVPISKEIKKLLTKMKTVQSSLRNIRLSFYDALAPPIFDRDCPCDGGILWCAVNSRGFVVPCTFFESCDSVRRLRALNIRETDFLEIWKSFSLFHQLRALKENIKGKCRGCSLLNQCAAGCRASAYSLKGDIFDADPQCPRSVQA